MDGPAVQDDPMSAISNSPIIDGESLDDILRDNSNEMQRRWSLTQPYSPHTLESSARRLSMMEFGSNFTFPNMGNTFEAMGNSGLGGGMNVSVPPNAQLGQANNDIGMVSMANAGAFSTLSPDMMGSMLAFSSLNMSPATTWQETMALFSPTSMGDQYMGNTVALENITADGFSMEMLTDNMPPPNSAPTPMMQRNDADSDVMGSGLQQQQPSLMQASMKAEAPQATPHSAPFKAPAPPPPPAAPAFSARQDPPGLQNLAEPIGPGMSKGKSVYSKSGFDMVRALYYVATRQNPQIQLGAVDLSCAFVVTDITLNDCPIVYVSSNFQNLTGYSQHEILGKNCRFLQAPDGQVEAGIKREFVEDHAVFNLKKAIAERREIQQSLINYRKGGKPFLNLLTMIPIPWETDELRYYVGFQIDVVECPDAITKHGMGGQLQVNYKNSDIGQYIWSGPGGDAGGGGSGTGAAAGVEQDSSQTLSAEDVSTLLRQFNPKGLVSDWHRQSWDKMLLENSDDVVHVLTPKGAFQYLSPSCKKVLGYEVSELVGPRSSKNTLTSLCHPSDVISVTRELKDASPANPTVNMAFRIQQKKKGYAWFESYGSLFVEAGKGRKLIVLVGRKRPVFTLHRKDVEEHGGGIGDSELWTKLSTSGMFLFVSSNIRSLLDLQPQDLVGTSIQDLMRRESRPEFGRTIEKARKGKMVSCKHEVQNRRGQVLQAQTTLYPGDGADDPRRRASFLLAQTKLIKASSRSAADKNAANPNGSGAAAAAAAGASNQDAAAAATASQPGSKPDGGGSTAATPATAGPGTTSAATAATATTAAATTMTTTTTATATTASDVPGVYTQLDDNMFEELNTTRCTSWQYELHQMEKVNRLLAEELGQLLSNRKKRKRRRSAGLVRDCANCHTRSTPEWRRGPSGQRDLCNSCGLRWAKQVGILVVSLI